MGFSSGTSTEWLLVHWFPNWKFLRSWFLRREENRENPEKNPRSTGENQQTTLLTYDTELSGARTRVALVIGERSHRYPPRGGWWKMLKQKFLQAIKKIREILLSGNIFSIFCINRKKKEKNAPT